MQFFTIESDGDIALPEFSGDVSWVARRSDYTVVQIVENEDVATLTFGFADANDDFVAFPSGEISTGKKIEHGFGCRLMVRAADIDTNPVVIALSTSGR